MPPAARISDMHTCPMVTGVVPHVGGPIIKGEPTVMIGFLPAARIGDQLTCVGPPDVIIKGSATVMIGYMPAARMGDSTAHGGVIVLGLPTVMIGDAGGGGGGGGGGGAGARSGGPSSEESASDSSSDLGDAQALLAQAASVGLAFVRASLEKVAEDKKYTFSTRFVIDKTDEPVVGLKVIVKIPERGEEPHVTDANGEITIHDLDSPAPCEVWCDITDARLSQMYDFVGRGETPTNTPDAGDANPRAIRDTSGEKKVAEVIEHKVKTGESLDSIAKANGMTWQELCDFNWGTHVPKEVNQFLLDYVGVTKRAPDGINYLFDDSDDPGIVYIPKQWKSGPLSTD